MNTISPGAASRAASGAASSAGRAAGPPPGWRITQQSLTVLTALALVCLAWDFTERSVRSAIGAAQTHADANVANIALAVEWQLVRKLQSIDGVMQMLQGQWRAQGGTLDLGAWAARSHVLDDMALRIAVVDSGGMVRDATDPAWRGTDLSGRDYVRAQRLPGAGLFVAPSLRWKEQGRWEITLSRRLDTPSGAFGGALVVSYDPWRLTNMLEQVELGPRGLVALVGDDGVLRPLVAPDPAPQGRDIAGSGLATALLARPHGVWSGPSALDGVARVHGFRRLPQQTITIVVGVAQDVALRAAWVWERSARLYAVAISAAVAGLAALLLRALHAARGREARLARDRTALAASYSEARTAWAAAEARTDQLHGILAGMSDGVMVLDSGLRLVLWNEHFARRTGVPEAMLRPGVAMAELLRAQAEAGEFGDEDPDEAVAWRLRELLDGDEPKVRQRRRPDGGSIEWRRTALPGGGFVTLYMDATARHRAEQDHAEARRLAEQAAAHKADFVAVVSHEIRTPLNAVLGSLALLERSGLTEPQRRLAGIARQGGDALLDLLNDVLEMSEMESGRLVLRPATVELRELLAGVADMFRPAAAERGVVIRVAAAADLPRWLRVDPGRLRQVIMNFAANAVKFGPSGSVTLRAERVRREDGDGLRLAVHDEGPGIPAEEVGRLFQPFSRLAHARDGGAPGTGLGLAICGDLARLMGGMVGVEPGPGGQGNAFWVVVPLVEAPAPLAEQAPAGPRRRRPVRLLLVEDIAANHLVTATLLRRAGHRVDVVETGAEAVAAVSARPYDLVLMDLVMPNMSGIDAARRIRALGGPAGRVGIVALTATTASEDRARCAQAGIEAVIGKPAPAGELLALVDLHAATIAGAARSDAPAAAAAAVSGRPFRDASPRASLPRCSTPSGSPSWRTACRHPTSTASPHSARANCARCRTGSARRCSTTSARRSGGGRTGLQGCAGSMG